MLNSTRQLLQVLRRAAPNEFDGCRPKGENNADDRVDRLGGLQPTTGMYHDEQHS